MIPRFQGIAAFSALLILSASCVCAQTYTAAKIEFSDRGEYSQKQLEDASGITIGSKLTVAELGAAAQRLMDTGFFENAGATVDGKIAAVTVKFDVKPIGHAQMLPVGFANFVWLTPAEINAAIQAKFPLFQGYLPENSPRQDDLKAALTAALAAKSITASVEYDEFEPTLRHPGRAIAFRVDKPSITVANVKLTGVTSALVPLVQKSVNSTARTAYTEGPADQTTDQRILAPLLDAGYVNAALEDSSVSVSPAANGYGVVLTTKLNPGAVFHVAGLSFAGTPLVSQESFAATAKLHTGDVASRALLLESLAPIDAAYRSKGYLDVAINAEPTMDATASTVAYAVSVDPGEQYRLKQVTPTGIEGAALADFNRGFLPKPGDVYNPTYVAGFLKGNTALQALTGYAAAYKAYADPNTHTVDLVISFYKMGH